MVEFVQFTVSGLTIGAVYALVALGFTLIYNASSVVNFAQGEFVMLGGMLTVFMNLAGVPIQFAAVLAVVAAPDALLVLDRDDVDASSKSVSRPDVISDLVSRDPVMDLERVRDLLDHEGDRTDRLRCHDGDDLAVADREGQVVRERRDAAVSRRVGGHER